MKTQSARLAPPIDLERDHISGRIDAPIQLVEFGDYECPYCRKAHDAIKETQQRFGDDFCYVFRHLPNLKLHPHAELAAEAAEAAAAQGKFWDLHDALFSSDELLELDALIRIADGLGLDVNRFRLELQSKSYAARVREDIDSAIRSDAHGTPSFYVNGRRYDGAWDTAALIEAIKPRLGFKMKRISQDFAGLPASGGMVLLLCSLLALVCANSPWAHAYQQFWASHFVLSFGDHELGLSLQEWVNQGLMALFFFIVGLEVKRELTVGELASPRRAALPIAAATGGLIVPAVIYLAFNSGGPHVHGWGIPISTDTAFTLGLLALLGARIPYSLKIFVAALAIADDVGAILVISVFYASKVSWLALAVAAALFVLAVGMNWVRVYRPLPYAILGICLWLAVMYSGVHATIAGVLLAMVIPTRGPPTTGGLLDQTIGAFKNFEAPLHDRSSDEGRYQVVVQTLETVVDRLLSPAQRLERDLQPWSTYFVLPLLALANAGIPLHLDSAEPWNPLSLGIVLGLVLGKPVGIVLATLLVVRTRLAQLPEDINWQNLVGAACLCGIGFTMSIFIANAAFADGESLHLAKLSIIFGSFFAALFGWFILRKQRMPLPTGET